MQTIQHTIAHDMMHYFLNSLRSYVVVLFLISQISFVAGISSPSQQYGKSNPQAANEGALNIAGLNMLRKYVCPSSTNVVRRQVGTKMTGAITVAIPLAEVSELWQELQWILEQLSVLLDAEGLLQSPTNSVFIPTMVASMIEQVTPTEVLLSTSGEVSNPSMTDLFILETTSTQEIALPSITLMGVASGNTLKVTDTAIGATGAPAATSTIGTPVSIPSLSSKIQEVSSSSNTTSFPDAVQTTQGSVCFVTPGFEETTVASHVDVTAFGAVATFTSPNPSNTPVSGPRSVISSITSLSNVGGFVATPVSSEPMSTGTSSYLFNSQSTQNIAVYYGQSGATGETTLEAQCADTNIDIVILAFVITSNFDGKYPDLNFGAACGGQTSEMMQYAPGLLSCPELEGYIDICQQTYGKKVLISIGGSTSSLSFASASDASDFANTLWQLFGPPGSIDIELRPFGNVSIDGFDIDNEDKQPAYFDTFATTLRTNYASDASKTYYISSAPQCPFPDASDPLSMLLLCDFVYVQFYNNPPCEIGSSNFTNSIQQWSTALSSSSRNPKPRLYLGAPAWSAAGYTAYEAIGSAEGMKAIAKSVKDMQLTNLGGGMFWDGPEAMLNTEGGKDILGWTKAGLAQ